MSKVFLAGFKAGKHRYEHTLDTETDEAFIHEQETGERIYCVNLGGWVYNKRGAIAGRFRKMDNGNWYYEKIDLSMRLNTKFKDLLEAERDVFSLLLSLGYNE